MDNASFSWTDHSVVLDVSMSVKPGQLVVVVGPVASGKSTLVSGVFGFAHLAAGTSQLQGTGMPNKKTTESQLVERNTGKI